MFAAVGEAAISRAIVKEFSAWIDEYITSEVIIVGGGPSGLVAARELAGSGYKTLVIEANNYLGGGFWIGGFLINTLTFRAPGNAVLDELGIPYRQVQPGLFVADGPHACARLIVSCCEAGAKVLNMVRCEDVVVKKGRVSGVVVNWSAVAALPRQITCVDPIAFEAKVVIDATGHDAHVCRSLERRGLLKLSEYGPMDVVSSEDAVLERTGEIFPGLLVSGMATATAYGLPRMGPTFSAMLLSGKRVAEVARGCLSAPSPEAAVVSAAH